MKPAPSLLRVLLALCLGLPTACATSRITAPHAAPRTPAPQPVTVSTLPDGRLRLSFGPVAPNSALDTLSVDEARSALVALHSAYPPTARSNRRPLFASAGLIGTESSANVDADRPGPAAWERRLRADYLERFGPTLIPLPESLEYCRFSLALSLSYRYMLPGARDAARELFSSPVFLASVTLSVAVYFAAWLAPEPIFTKAAAVALTVRLALAVGLAELGHLALACLRLFQEAEAATTLTELEAAAEHFGRVMGGSTLRTLVLVASFGTARVLPEVPLGGFGKLLPRYSLAGGLTWGGGATTAQVMADGTLAVTGVVVATTAASAHLAAGGCTDGSQKKNDHSWHHLATNKNELSPAQGGPWTPLFEQLFAQAGMNLDDPANRVYLKGHRGPHSEEYHTEVYRRLKAALGPCKSPPHCRINLTEELRKLAVEICTPGSWLHQLATKP